MKSAVLFVFLLLSVSIMAQSPISKGTFNLNGNLSFSSQSYDEGDVNRNVLSLNPQVGYFFYDNISLSLSMNYDRISLGDASNTNWGIGPNLRYYFDLEKVKPFFSLGYFYTETTTSGNDNKWKGSQLSFGCGLDYFISKNVALESIVSYNINNDTLPDSYKSLYKSLEQKSYIFKIGVGINFFLY